MHIDTEVGHEADVIENYVELLDARASKPSPFGKIAALAKMSALRRLLVRAVARGTAPEFERAEAAVVADTTASWGRRFASSFWGNRLLMAAALVGGQQLVLLLLFLLAKAYVNLVPRAVDLDTGLRPPASRYGVLFLILFVFGFFFVTPVLSILMLWGGRFLRAWRKTFPAALLMMLAAAAFTYLAFRGTTNPAFSPDSTHQFTESRKLPSFAAYEKWLDLNWLLKDPKFRADYEQYVRNGPGRWLTNRFDTTKSEEWARPETLAYIGEFVDQHHDQAKFREWLQDYVERNKIYSEGIDEEIDKLVQQPNQRFLSVWQAAPYLADRDAHMERNYYGQVFEGVRKWGLVFFGSLVGLYLLLYLVGPLLKTSDWVAGRLKLTRAATVTGRARNRYYSFPERGELSSEPFFDSSYAILARVHRSYVRTVLVVSVLVFAAWSLWLASRTADANVASQAALMDRFVLLPMTERVATVQAAALPVASPAGGPALAASAGGTGLALAPAAAFAPASWPGPGFDLDGNGLPDAQPVSPLDARLAEIEKQIDDADYDTRKRFKETDALLADYRREIAALRAENARLAGRQDALAQIPASVAALQGRIGGASAAAESAAARAEAVANETSAVAARVTALDQRADDLDRRAGQLAQRDDAIQNSVDAVATDLDERARQLGARTERLGERATDIADRTEQLASLQIASDRYLVEQARLEISGLERRSHSRFYRMLNRKEALAELADLRRRLQVARGQLQTLSSPEAASLMKALTDLQHAIDPVEALYE